MKPEDKDAARDGGGRGDRRRHGRCRSRSASTASAREWHGPDVVAVMHAQGRRWSSCRGSRPRRNWRSSATRPGSRSLAMIETAEGRARRPTIAHEAAALIAGTNDLAADLRLPRGAGRAPLQMALQSIVLAARAARNRGVRRCLSTGSTTRKALPPKPREGRMLGFDGKSLIHPDQIAPCHAAFAPTDDGNRARRAAGRGRHRRRRAVRGRDDRADACRGGASGCWRAVASGTADGVGESRRLCQRRAWPTFSTTKSRSD